MKQSKKAFLVLSIFVAFFINACGEEHNPFGPVDYSNAPEPFSTAEAEKVETSSGLVYYIIEEGSGEGVDRRNSIYLFYTGRKMDGEIFDSSYKNGKTTSTRFADLGSLVEGFTEGLIGMKEGEKRVLIIPPSLGYGGSETHFLRNDTLRFDIELDEIQY